MEWVRHNVAAFGGDPDNITIFGVSAGANDIAAHLVSPTSSGLFHKAVIESLVGPGVNNVSLAPAEASDLAAIHSADTSSNPLGCLAVEISADQLLACLRSLPATALVSLTSPGEIVDGVIVPQFPPAAFANGDFNRVRARGLFSLERNRYGVSTWEDSRASPSRQATRQCGRSRRSLSR